MAKLHYDGSVSEKEKEDFARLLAEDEELILATGFGKIYLRSLFVILIVWPGIIFWIIGLGLAYLLQINVGIGLLAGLLFSILFAFIKTTHAHHANRYLLTSRRVIIKKGFFAVKLTSALYDKITHIEVIQSLSDKFLYRHGKIIINTAGANKDELILKYVGSPVEFKNILEKMINRERAQFGGSSGSVTTIEGELVD